MLWAHTSPGAVGCLLPLLQQRSNQRVVQSRAGPVSLTFPLQKPMSNSPTRNKPCLPGEGSGPALPWGRSCLGHSAAGGTNRSGSPRVCSNNRVIDVYDNLPFPEHLTDCPTHEKRPKCLYSVGARVHLPRPIQAQLRFFFATRAERSIV